MLQLVRKFCNASWILTMLGSSAEILTPWIVSFSSSSGCPATVPERPMVYNCYCNTSWLLLALKWFLQWICIVEHINLWNPVRTVHPDTCYNSFSIDIWNVVVVGICSLTAQEISGFPIGTILGDKNGPCILVGDHVPPQVGTRDTRRCQPCLQVDTSRYQRLGCLPRQHHTT